MTTAHRTGLFAFLFFLAPPASSEISKAGITEHIHKRYSTPLELKMSIGDLKTGPIPGFLSGKIDFEGPRGKSSQEIHVSEDGKKYFLAPLYKLIDSDIPGLLVPDGKPGAPAPPPIYITPDGKHILTGAFGKPQDITADPDKDNIAKMLLKEVHAIGPAEAPVTLVAFSDLQCPYCAKAHENIEKVVGTAHKGKVRWVSKHYPLKNNHPWAYQAAIAASCAGKQKPEAFHKLQSGYYKDQKTFTVKNLREKSLALAKNAGIDGKQFEKCYDGKLTEKAVIADMAEGESLGVDSTPTIFINGRLARGISEEALKELIDEMLASKK